MLFFSPEFYSVKENKEGQRKHLSLSWNPFYTDKEQIMKREMSGNKMVGVKTTVCI